MVSRAHESDPDPTPTLPQSQESPGRVVTLVSRDSPSLIEMGLEEGEVKARVFGMVYELDPETQQEVMAHLDYREKVAVLVLLLL